jgi:hypothetical protein
MSAFHMSVLHCWNLSRLAPCCVATDNNRHHKIHKHKAYDDDRVTKIVKMDALAAAADTAAARASMEEGFETASSQEFLCCSSMLYIPWHSA